MEVMQGRKLSPLLCELHAHTTWSDGRLSLTELVDLYGRNGFDVLCITDHALPMHDPWLLANARDGVACSVSEDRFDAYLAAIDAEAARARATYSLLVLPGLELTYNDLDPDRAAHAVAVGLREWVSLEQGLEHALVDARAAGAALVAAHPHGFSADPLPLRTTRRFYREHETLAPLVDRFELFNRHTLFGWVAAAGLPAVASGDFHRLEHLSTWKTLLPCVKDEAAVVGYLRSSRPAFLVRLDEAHVEAIAA
jgi:hypothetical protein